MTIRKRRVLFYSLLAIFFILGAAIVLYASGWRFDIKTFRAERVGAIFIRSFPEDAKIYLNGKATDSRPGLFQSGTVINNLFPKSYKVSLSLDGYEAWQENVSVLPSLVTRLPYAVLVPKNSAEVASGTIKNFWLLGENIATELVGGQLKFGEGKLGVGEIIGWSSDYQYILTFNKNTDVYGWFDTSTNKNFNVSSALKKLGFSASRKYQVLADPTDKKRLIILESGMISLFDTSKSTLSLIYKAGSKKYLGENIASSQFYLAWTEFNLTQNTSTIIVYDKFLRKSLSDAPEFKGNNKKLEWTADKKIAALQDDGSLYLYDPANDVSEKIADDVKGFTFADDNSAVAALEHGALEIIPLSQNQDYHKFNLPGVDSVQKLYWYSDNNHLFIEYPDHVNFLDLNDAGLNNFTAVAEGTSVSGYNVDDNRFYILKNNAVFVVDFPK